MPRNRRAAQPLENADLDFMGPQRMQPVETAAKAGEVFATGSPGTVYLCHPFLVHAAQRHRGSRVKFMAQPPLLPAKPLEPHSEN